MTADDQRVAPATAGDVDRSRFRNLSTSYLADLQAALSAMDLDAILRIVERLRVARDAVRTIFIAGNGGSAATASHWVNDLAKATKRSGRRAIRVIGLVDNVLRPMLVGKDAKMPDYVVLVSTLGGMAIFGLNGFVIGPVIAAMFMAAWHIVETEHAGDAG